MIFKRYNIYVFTYFNYFIGNNDNGITTIPPSPSPVKQIEQHYQVLCSPRSTKWTVKKDKSSKWTEENYGNIIFEKQSNDCVKVKRVLFQDNNKRNKPGYLPL